MAKQRTNNDTAGTPKRGSNLLEIQERLMNVLDVRSLTTRHLTPHEKQAINLLISRELVTLDGSTYSLTDRGRRWIAAND